VAVTGSVRAFASAQPQREPRLALSDHLGPEDLRRATGAMALALDPQGNGSPVSWDNAESKASGRFTPVGGPFLHDDEVCRAFLSQISTPMDKVALQGTACRPSGGTWSIRDMKPWKQPA
jgi:surface antigen